jgi:hypothetical protein
VSASKLKTALGKDLTGTLTATQTRNVGYAVIVATAVSGAVGVLTLHHGLGVLFVAYALISAAVALRINSVAVGKAKLEALAAK